MEIDWILVASVVVALLAVLFCDPAVVAFESKQYEEKEQESRVVNWLAKCLAMMVLWPLAGIAMLMVGVALVAVGAFILYPIAWYMDWLPAILSMLERCMQ